MIPPLPAKVYRLRRYYLALGIGGVIFYSALAIGSVVVAGLNVDDSFAHPLLGAASFGLFWSAWVLASVWVILAYLRGRLVFDRTTITDRGVIRSKVVDVRDVTQVIWCRNPRGGGVIIRTPRNKLKVHLENFPQDERQGLISILRDAFGPDIQEGWLDFTESRSPVKRQRRSRVATVGCALMLFTFGGIFTHRWMAGFGIGYLILGIANLVVALWSVWRAWVHGKQAAVEA